MRHHRIDVGGPVLLLDTRPMSRRIMAAILRNAGIADLLHADDSDAGMAIIQARKDIGLVVCDWDMFPLSGLDCLRRIRQSRDTPTSEIPFVLTSSRHCRDRMMDATLAGVDAFCLKPLTVFDVHDAVRNATAIRKYRGAAQ